MILVTLSILLPRRPPSGAAARPTLKMIHWIIFRALRAPQGEGFWYGSLTLDYIISYLLSSNSYLGECAPYAISATLSTSSIFSVRTISNSFRTCSGTSSKSFWFSFGRRMVLMPAR